MAYSGQTTHYGLPKYVSTDKPSWLDTNNAFDTIDAAIYAAATAVDPTDITNLQNDVTALQANKQDVLTFDAAPTSGSVNPVTSGGVYTAIDNVSTAISTLDTNMKNRTKSGEINISNHSTWGAMLSEILAAMDAANDGLIESFQLVMDSPGSTQYLNGTWYRNSTGSDIVVFASISGGSFSFEEYGSKVNNIAADGTTSDITTSDLSTVTSVKLYIKKRYTA